MKRTNEYARRHLFWLVLVVLMIMPARLSDAATVRCDVIDVIEMVQDGLVRTEIREECDGKVDARRCTLTKVVRLAKAGLDEFDIEDECSDEEPRFLEDPQRNAPPRRATICDTPYASCPIMVGVGRPGEPCWCATAFGTAYGIAR